MSERALEFVENWVSENVTAEGTTPATPDVGNSQAKLLARQCIVAASAAGIPEYEIQEAFDDLAAFIGGQIEEADEREAARSASNDNDAQ